MTIKITTPNSGADALTFGSATTATVAEVTGTEVSSGEGKLELKTTTGGVSTSQLSINAAGDLSFNSGYGSAATAYGCRAWVNFNGTSTVAIRASGNVSSITDNGTGNYTVNFAVAMPDVNYAVMGLASSTMTGRAASVSPHFSGTYSTSATQFLVKDSADVTIDSVTVSIAILR